MKNILKKGAALLLVSLLITASLAGCGAKSDTGKGNSSLQPVTLNEVAHSILYPYIDNTIKSP